MPDQSPFFDVSVADGKYRIVMSAKGKLYALRYEESWRSLTGDKLVFALARELEDARKKIKELEQQIEDAAEEHREREEK